MGQYYKVYLRDESTGKESFFIQSMKYKKTGDFAYHYGKKITEHAWIGNDLTDYVSHKLFKNRCILAWVGDYAEDTPQLRKNYLSKKIPSNFLERARGTKEKEAEQEDYFQPTDKKFDYTNTYFINWDKFLVVKLDNLPESSGIGCLYPIALLTAVGNGKGGGDYYGTCQEYVGTWALDKVSIEQSVPAGFQIIAPIFTEN